MKLAVPKETTDGETRVAATPESVKKLKSLGLDVVVETGAGAAAHIADADYVAAGASIAPDARTALADADIVLKVRGPSAAEIAPDQKRRRGGGLARASYAKRPRSRLWRAKASSPSPWNFCRAFPAPRRWTCCRRKPISPATRR